MDLRDMLNDNGPAAATPSKPQPPPPPPPSMPSTPVQTNTQQSFRDYSQTHPSPARQMSLDYTVQQAPPGMYASPPPYQAPAGPYPNRPAPPPPLLSPNDLRSPSIASGPGPSPYRQTPTSSISAASGGYPFPPQGTPTSPVQRHQYPPPGAYHRDSYPQPSVPVGMTGPPGPVSYMQGPQVPQTPPVVTPGGHPYPHQRSHSTHSTPTPTSAQSQQGQYGAPFIQGSPMAAHHSLPQMEMQQRHSSQPPTPVAPPLSRPAQTMSFGQPPSPYQQRLPAAVTYPHPPSQISPPPPPPPSLPRHTSNTTLYDPLSQDIHRISQSRADRDRSISVSPKTRVPGLPGSAGRPGTSISNSDPHHLHMHPASVMPSVMPSATDSDRDRERAVTPAKRKLDDRELRPEELERRELRPPPFEDTMGRNSHVETGPPPPGTSTRPEKKRRIYQTAPVWAQTLQGRRPTHANYTLYRPTQHPGPQVNGKPSSLPSRHTSPEEKRAVAPAHAPPAAQPVMPVAQVVPDAAPAEGPLGPWEPSITNEIPQDSMSKVVADFLFQHVIMNENIGEIQSRGVNFEIEAKLGTLLELDRATNQRSRVKLAAITDCVLSDAGNWLGFRSSMSEAQHKQFNDFLNSMVLQAHPKNETRSVPRVPIEYLHRKQIDKFFELPPNIRDQVLPPCVANPIAARGHAAKVRVTYDQKTKEVLAKIVKARIADINLYFPDCPLDCRISINLEMDYDGAVEDLERLSAASNRPPPPDRNKDRLSYTHGHYQIDLTQVTPAIPGANSTQRVEKEHELEIEVAPLVLIDQGRRAREGRPHQYLELVEGLINNIKVLARKANEFGL